MLPKSDFLESQLTTSLEGKDEGANQRRNHADMVPADRDVSRGSWKKNGALHSVIRVSDQAATSACLRTSLRPW